MAAALWCTDCRKSVGLDLHGNCELCGNPEVQVIDTFRPLRLLKKVLRMNKAPLRKPQYGLPREAHQAPMQLSGKLRILIADDHDIVRRGLRAFLSSRPGWEVCAEAATGREAIAMAERHQPDIVVMDIAMPELNGLEAARHIRSILPKTEIVFLSAHYTDELVREVLATGAHSYILKSDADKELLLAVEALATHRSFFTSRAEQMIIDDARKKGSATQPLIRNRLTVREREILQRLAEGKSSKEVAAALGISVKTAETHRANIMRKLDLHSVSELVRYAIRNHMLEP